MDKQASKYFNTATRMDEAFLSLLNKKDFEYITVKEICDLAGVNRSTFYLHYENVNELLEETMNYINTKFISYFSEPKINIQNIDTLPLEDLYLINPEYLYPWLAFTKDNSKLFQTFLKRYDTLKIAVSYQEIFKKVVAPILNRYNAPTERQEYIFLFYVEGIVGIVKQWIREDFSKSIEEMISLIMECVKHYEK